MNYEDVKSHRELDINIIGYSLALDEMHRS